MSLGFSLQENGCLRVIPGTHKAHVEHVNLGNDSSAFEQGIASELVDESKAIDLEMSPGQISFFNEATFHGSNPNNSSIPRVAFSVRYTTPEVKFKVSEWGGDTARIKTFLVRGEDRHHLNDEIIGIVPIQ
jgi:ectoine hydroxylase-related dioxygenase (phytanoyl-CoA dioxygenase family)